MRLHIEVYDLYGPAVRTVIQGEVAILPRVSDYIVVDGITYKVKSVSINYDEKVVIVRVQG